MKHLPTIAFAALAILCLCGCGKRESFDEYEGEVIGEVSKSEAQRQARMIAMVNGGTFCAMDSTLKASNSMGAYITKYSYVIVVPAWESLKPGKLVIRQFPGGLGLHLVTYSDGLGNFKTSGTTNSRSDSGWLTADNYLGTYHLSIPYDPNL